MVSTYVNALNVVDTWFLIFKVDFIDANKMRLFIFF